MSGASGWRHGTRAFRHVTFRRFWFGALVSNSGTWLQNLTVPYVLLQLTDRASWVGLATFASLMPVMLLSPLAGNVADRFDRRRSLLVGQTAAAAGALLLSVAWSSGVRDPATILAFTAVAGVLNGFNAPIWQAFIPSLVPVDDLSSAISLNSLQFNMARAIGPAIGGGVIAIIGPGWAFAINALSYGAVLLSLVLIDPGTIRAQSSQRRPVLRGFGETITYIRRQPGIVGGIGVACVVAFLGFPVVGFVVIYAKQVYDVGAGTVGVLTGLLGIGAILAAPIVAGVFGDLSRATTVKVALPLYGLSIALFGVSTEPVLGGIGLTLAGAGFLTLVATSNTTVQTIVADRIRGRVMAIRIMAFTASYPVGALVQTQLAERSNARLVVTVAGCTIVAIGTLTWLAPRLVQSFDDPPDLTTA